MQGIGDVELAEDLGQQPIASQLVLHTAAGPSTQQMLAKATHRRCTAQASRSMT